MFDILVYLFENYVHADACPEPAQLARKLTADDLLGTELYTRAAKPAELADGTGVRDGRVLSTVGLKLLGEVMLKNRSHPLFEEFGPQFGQFMKRLKNGNSTANQASAKTRS